MQKNCISTEKYAEKLRGKGGEAVERGGNVHISHLPQISV